MTKDIVVLRLCSLPPASGIGERKTQDCGHPSLRYKPASEHCVGCIVSSVRGGNAVDVPAKRNTAESIKE